MTSRRHTLKFTSKAEQDKLKLCAPVPPRIKDDLVHQDDEVRDIDDKQLNVISVLGLLTALEDILGSLGPKVIQLMLTAQSMDKTTYNSSCELLEDNENFILFETIKEKLKGLISANLVESKKIDAVKKAIKDMSAIVDQTEKRQEERKKLQLAGTASRIVSSPQDTPLRPETTERLLTVVPKKTRPPPPPSISDESVAETKSDSSDVSDLQRALIKEKLRAALIKQGRINITDSQLDEFAAAYFQEVQKKAENERKTSQKETESEASNDTLELDQSLPFENRVKIISDISIRPDPSTKTFTPATSFSGTSLPSTSTSRPNLPASAHRSSSSSILRPTLPAPAPQTSSGVSFVNRPPSSTSHPTVPASTPRSSSGATFVNRPMNSTFRYDLPTSASQSSFSVFSVNRVRLNTPATQSSNRTVSNTSNKTSQPIMDSEPVVLTDANIKVLMKKFDKLAENEKDSYLKFIKALKDSDPKRYQRLKDEHENESASKPNLKKASNKQESVISDDDDDTAVLAASIAESQQQIAQMTNFLKPRPPQVSAGCQIPVIDTCQPARNSTVRRPIDINRQQASNIPPLNGHCPPISSLYQHHPISTVPVQPYHQQYPFPHPLSGPFQNVGPPQRGYFPPPNYYYHPRY